MGRYFWTGFVCALFGCLGWIAISIAALAFSGGHPPLSMYVGIPVLLLNLPMNGTGAIICGLGIYRRRIRPAAAAWFLLIINFALAVISVLCLLS